MTLTEWVETRTPAPPPRLSHRIRELLGEGGSAEATAGNLLDAAERLLRELTARPALARDSALDLLAADALVTYAFEAAADAPDSLSEATARAMERLSAVAE